MKMFSMSRPTHVAVSALYAFLLALTLTQGVPALADSTKGSADGVTIVCKCKDKNCNYGFDVGVTLRHTAKDRSILEYHDENTGLAETRSSKVNVHVDPNTGIYRYDFRMSIVGTYQGLDNRDYISKKLALVLDPSDPNNSVLKGSRRVCAGDTVQAFFCHLFGTATFKQMDDVPVSCTIE